MNEGIKKAIRKQIQKIKDYLKENQETLTEDEINEALEEIASQIEMLELLDG
jgi:DNA-binding transcriptional regulator GbsR (MarR family)